MVLFSEFFDLFESELFELFVSCYVWKLVAPLSGEVALIRRSAPGTPLLFTVRTLPVNTLS